MLIMNYVYIYSFSFPSSDICHHYFLYIVNMIQKFYQLKGPRIAQK